MNNQLFCIQYQYRQYEPVIVFTDLTREEAMDLIEDCFEGGLYAGLTFKKAALNVYRNLGADDQVRAEVRVIPLP